MQEITDISANCGTSFSIVIVSKDFEKKMKLARHKLGERCFRMISLQVADMRLQ